MMVARRVARRDESLTPGEWAWLLDLPAPADADAAERWALDFAADEFRPGRLSAFELWCEQQGAALAAHIAEHPGTRLSHWWRYSPLGLRERIGGVGTPAHEWLAYAPAFRFGVPATWPTREEAAQYGRERRKHGVDPDNPPTYESQAAFLRRHKLLSRVEAAQLGPEAYEPESIFDALMNRAAPEPALEPEAGV